LTNQKKRAPRNKTIRLSDSEKELFLTRLLKMNSPVTIGEILDKTICQDIYDAVNFLPSQSIDLLFADPPYNLGKSFNGRAFSELPLAQYEKWLDSWISKLPRILKPTASVYICGDWRSSSAIHRILEKYFIVRNRITWEREKGRGAKANWKNSSEDIWFCTMSKSYVFNVDDVKLKRKVIAPYTNKEGLPKDWNETDNGRFRLTHPSNLWTDLTVPFWSMAENSDHPTQKPEKLLAKIILASSSAGDVVFDPFLGSGTTSVVAKKLNRHYVGVEIDEHYCCIAEKRLTQIKVDAAIQGYSAGVFWERNTLADQKKTQNESKRT